MTGVPFLSYLPTVAFFNPLFMLCIVQSCQQQDPFVRASQMLLYISPQWLSRSIRWNNSHLQMRVEAASCTFKRCPLLGVLYYCGTECISNQV